jgi:flagellar protein FlbD
VIRLTRINHIPIVLNSDWIEHIEVTPDTVITLTNGQKYLVLESAEEIVQRVISFRRAIRDGGLFYRLPSPPVSGGEDGE